MPQGTRKCGCPARWCSCGGTVNKSELRTKPKVSAARNAVAVAPPPGKSTQAEVDAKIQKGALKVPPATEGFKRNALEGKAAPKSIIEPAFPKGGENSQLVKEPIIKRGRSSVKSLGLDSIAGKPLREAEAKVDENKNVYTEQPLRNVHKSQRNEALVCAPVPPKKPLRNRETGSHVNAKVQTEDRVLQNKSRSTQATHPGSAGRLRSRIKRQITRIRREEALLEAYGGRYVTCSFEDCFLNLSYSFQTCQVYKIGWRAFKSGRANLTDAIFSTRFQSDVYS